MAINYEALYTELRNIIKDKALCEKVISIVDKKRMEDKISRNEKQRAGIAKAQSEGIKCGRKPTPRPAGFQRVLSLYLDAGLTISEAAALLDVSRSVFYRWLCEERRKAPQADQQ